MKHASSALLEHVSRPADLGAPGFWRDFLLVLGMLKPVAATSVVAMAVALSFSQSLGLEHEMPVAVARGFLQLTVVGFVLHFIFAQKNALWILLAYLFMVTTRTQPAPLFDS
jgi:putative ABC transport system permease protein